MQQGVFCCIVAAIVRNWPARTVLSIEQSEFGRASAGAVTAEGDPKMVSRPLAVRTTRIRSYFPLHASAGLRSAMQVSSLVIFVLLAGCGPSYNKVNGTVSYKGKNLTMGTITFYSGDGKTKSFTTIGSNGFYELIDPPLGKVRVGIAVKPPPSVKLIPGKDKEGIKPKAIIGDTPSTPVEPVLIPVEYADPGKSGLTAELSSGSNTHNIDLVEKGTPPSDDTKKQGKKK